MTIRQVRFSIVSCQMCFLILKSENNFNYCWKSNIGKWICSSSSGCRDSPLASPLHWEKGCLLEDLTILLNRCLNSTVKRTCILNEMRNVICAAAFMSMYPSCVCASTATSALTPPCLTGRTAHPPQTTTCQSRAPVMKRPSAAPLARAWTRRTERRRRRPKGRRPRKREKGRRKPMIPRRIWRRRPKRKDLAS